MDSAIPSVFYIAEIIGLYETVFIIVQKHNVTGDEENVKDDRDSTKQTAHTLT